MRNLEGKKQEIIDKYLSGQSVYDLQDYFGVSRETIRRFLISQNIIRRSISEINHLRFRKDIPMSENLLKMMTGWLLGDGGLHFTGKQAYFNFTSKHKEYIEYVKNILENEKIPCRTNKVFDKKYKTYAYKLFTASTVQFAELYILWYKNKIKIVPIDIKLSPETIKNWIMDDGTFNARGGTLRFCTCSFTSKECDSLSDKLNDFIGFNKASWTIERQKYPRIYLPRIYTNKLFNIIGKCEVKCFEYKWSKDSKLAIGGLPF